MTVSVLWLFLNVPLVGLQCVIAFFPFIFLPIILRVFSDGDYLYKFFVVFVLLHDLEVTNLILVKIPCYLLFPLLYQCETNQEVLSLTLVKILCYLLFPLLYQCETNQEVLSLTLVKILCYLLFPISYQCETNQEVLSLTLVKILCYLLFPLLYQCETN